MKKLGGIICDNPGCRKVCKTWITIPGKNAQLHYCSERCKDKHYNIPKIIQNVKK